MKPSKVKHELSDFLALSPGDVDIAKDKLINVVA